MIQIQYEIVFRIPKNIPKQKIPHFLSLMTIFSISLTIQQFYTTTVSTIMNMQFSPHNQETKPNLPSKILPNTQLSNLDKQLKEQENYQFHDMRQIFMNSVKINKKLHGEIIAKQHSVKNQAHQINLKLQTLYRDMEEIYNKTQKLYEETIRQNQKSRFIAEEMIKPFREELRGKVDQTTLSLKMKMMLSEFDNLGHEISYDQQKKIGHVEQNHAFKFIKTQLLPLMSSLSEESKKLRASFERQEQETNFMKLHQNQFQKEVNQLRAQVFEIQTTLIDEINRKTCDEIWQYRLKQFYSFNIHNKLQAITQLINNNQNQNKQNVNNLKIIVDLNHSRQIKQEENRLREMSKSINEIRKQINDANVMIFGKKVDDLKRNFEENNKIIKKDMQNLHKTLINQQINKIIEQNKQVKAKLSNFESSLSEKLTLRQDKGLSSKLTKQGIQIKKIQQFLKDNKKKLDKHQQQISIMKDILSKKANFSDMIHQVENKANKQDYKQLKDLIQGKSYTNEQNEQQSMMITQQEPKECITPFRARRQSTSSRGHYQKSVSPYVQDSQKDESVKRYMLGLKNTGIGANYNRENLLSSKTRFMFLNQTERRLAKGKNGETFTEQY